MKPWWVITLLPDAGDLNHASLKEQLDAQLLTWSLLSGVLKGENAPRWWTIDAFCPETEAEDENQLVHQIESFLYDPINPGNGKAPKIGGDIEPGELNIAIIGDVRLKLTRDYWHCLGRMLRLSQTRLFPARSLRVIGLIYLPSDAHNLKESEQIAQFLIQLSTAMNHEIVAERPYDFVLIFQETNATIENQGGYTRLTESQVSELFVQSLFHLMNPEDSLLPALRQAHDIPYFSMGAAAIYYDWERHKQELAGALGETLLQQFKCAKQTPFVNNQEAERAVADLKAQTEIRKLFQAFVFDEAIPSFQFSAKIWEGAKDRYGRNLSPWALHKTELLYLYFFRYLKQLPLRLSEYARLFLTTSMQQFRDFLGKRRGQIWEGHSERGERGLRQILDETIRSVFKGEFGQARSIEQVRSVLDKIRQVCNPAFVDSQLVAIDTFQKLEVFAVPEFLREFYNQASDTLTDEKENQLYDRLVDTIRAHPIPLALFLRAMLLAIMLAFLSERALDWLSPSILNLEWLLAIPGLALGILAAIPIAVAFWRYKVRTLNAIQKQILSYVGAILRHAQTKAKEQVRAEIAALFEQVKEYCDTVDEFLNTLSKKFNYPQSPRSNYTSTAFQRFLLEDLEIPGRGRSLRILSQVPEPEIEVAGKRKRFAECNAEEQNALLHQALDQSDPQDDSRRIIFQLLCDGLPNQVNDDLLESASRLLRKFAESLYNSVPQLHDLLQSDSDLPAPVCVRRTGRPSEARQTGRLQQTVECLRTLSFPPVAFHLGAQRLPVHFEWQYGSCDELKNFIPGADECTKIEGKSILSLAGYRPIQQLSDIATIHAMREKVHVEAICWDDLASIFILATTKLEGTDSLMFNNFDGSPLEAVAVQSRVNELQQKLHLQQKEEETDVHLPV
jgi:hypothetical protein